MRSSFDSDSNENGIMDYDLADNYSLLATLRNSLDNLLNLNTNTAAILAALDASFDRTLNLSDVLDVDAVRANLDVAIADIKAQLVAAGIDETVIGGVTPANGTFVNLAIKGSLGFGGDVEDLVISNGVVTPTKSYITIDTEASAATDNCYAISSSNFNVGDFLVVQLKANARVVTLQKSGGNIKIPVDRILDNTHDRILFQQNANDEWDEIAYSDSSGTIYYVNGNFTGDIVVNGTVDGRDIDADGTKLDGIEAGATADQTGAQIKAAYQLEANAFTDTKNTKLTGIETGATADQSDAEIAAALASEGIDATVIGGTTPAEGSFTNLDIIGRLGFGGAEEDLIISNGVITPTTSHINIDTENLDPSDNCYAISSGNFNAGDFLVIQCKNNARVITLQKSGGNLNLSRDRILNNTHDRILLQQNTNDEWDEIAYSDSSGTQYAVNGDFLGDVLIAGKTKLEGVVGYGTSEDLILATGSVTPTKTYIRIDTEASAATDFCDTIATTNFSAGDILVIRSTDTTRDVTYKDGTGNLNLPVDRTLTKVNSVLVLICVGGSWTEVSYTNHDAVIEGISGDFGSLANAQIDGVLGFNGSAELNTISAGVITPTKSYIAVNTEASAATDELDTIAVTNFQEGDLLYIRSHLNSADTTVINGSGNISVPHDRLLNNKTTWLCLMCTGAGWDEVSYTKNVGSGWDYESAETAIVLGGLTTFTHGLRVKPNKFQVYLVCQIAELNYSVGDEVEMGTNNRISRYIENATEIKIIVALSAPQIHNATTGSLSVVTLANWKYVLRASL